MFIRLNSANVPGASFVLNSDYIIGVTSDGSVTEIVICEGDHTNIAVTSDPYTAVCQLLGVFDAVATETPGFPVNPLTVDSQKEDE